MRIRAVIEFTKKYTNQFEKEEDREKDIKDRLFERMCKCIFNSDKLEMNKYSNPFMELSEARDLVLYIFSNKEIEYIKCLISKSEDKDKILNIID